jgi:uncharacterized membrane protein YphA (DoxX/SURF4 family)
MNLLKRINLNHLATPVGIFSILLPILFVITGTKGLLGGFSGYVDSVMSKNIPFPTIVTLGVLLLKVVGGSMVALQIPYSKLAAYALIVFTILATVLFHNPFQDSSQLKNMLSNLSIVGGLGLYANLMPHDPNSNFLIQKYKQMLF